MMRRVPRELTAPRPGELPAIVLTGILHVAVELGWRQSAGRSVEVLYNATAIALWGLYVLRCLIRTPGLARAWGFRRDTFLPAFRRCLAVVIPAAAGMGAWAWWSGRPALSSSFAVVLLLYPLYGIAQQFALQALIARNLRGRIGRRGVRIAMAAALFSAAHFPDVVLMGLTLFAGLVLTWIYESHPNLWAVGIAHGFLGALAYYLVLDVDPLAGLWP